MAQNEQTTEEHSTLEQQSPGRLDQPAWCVVSTVTMKGRLLVLYCVYVCVTQVVLERGGRELVFELNDRLIRDGQLDGLTEIPLTTPSWAGRDQPLKPAASDEDDDVHRHEADERGENFVPATLRGQYLS